MISNRGDEMLFTEENSVLNQIWQSTRAWLETVSLGPFSYFIWTKWILHDHYIFEKDIFAIAINNWAINQLGIVSTQRVLLDNIQKLQNGFKNVLADKQFLHI